MSLFRPEEVDICLSLLSNVLESSSEIESLKHVTSLTNKRIHILK